MKLKTTFTGSDNLKEKRHSVFYSDVPPGHEVDCLEEDDKLSPESDENTIIDNKSVIDLSVSPENAKFIKTKEYEEKEEHSVDLEFSPDLDSDSLFLVGSMGTQYEMNASNRKVGFMTRPDNLELIDDTAYPVRPPRHIKKKNMEKRDQRLLSVPNIKFHKADIPSFKDLRDKEDNVVSPQSSFAGNLMRRFSKF